MNKIIWAIIALLVLSAMPAQALVGAPFLRGVKSPSDLAIRIQASLDKDASGKSIIDDARCIKDHSCASPENYLEMFKESDPEAGLENVSQLPGYLKTLRVEIAPDGEYWLACLKLQKSGMYKPVLHCVSRRFKEGETAWVNRSTHRIVLASNCANPVEKEVVKKCAEVHFLTKVSDTAVRFALMCPKPLSDECIGVKKAGESEFQRWWTDECVDSDCNFSAASTIVGQPVQLAGSYEPQPGEHVLRLPMEVTQESSTCRVVLCLDRGGEHSDGMGVQWFDYSPVGPMRTKTATVWYSKEEVPLGMPRLYWPWGEWSGQ